MNFDHSFDTIFPTVGDSIVIGSAASGLGGFVFPIGTTAQRPTSPAVGNTRWNTTLGVKEEWNGTQWMTALAVPSSANSFPAYSVLAAPSGVAGAPTFRTMALDDLSDVVVTSPAATQILTYNGTSWVNTANSGANKVQQQLTGNIAPQTATYGQYVLSATAPTSATGTQIWTQSITPQLSTSRILVQFMITVAAGTAGVTFTGIVLAGTTVISGAQQICATAGVAYQMNFSAVYSPGTTTAQTISFRLAQTGTTACFINETSATLTAGGLLKTQYIITETA